MRILSSVQKMGMAAVILAASAFLSRIMGLVRDKIISWQYGAGNEADLYFAAFVVPDIINYLLAGAFMSITIIPILAKGFQEDERETWKFFSCVFLWMFLMSCLFTLLGEIYAPELAYLTAPGFTADQTERLAWFMRIILPAQIFFLSGAPFTALLLLRRQFTVPALTPLIYNGFIIICGLTWPWLAESANIHHTGMSGYCLGVTVGAFVGAFLLPLQIARNGGIVFYKILSHKWLKKFLLIALPLMLGQTVVMLDEQFLRVFGSMLPEGSVSLLNYGRRIAQAPVALMGQAIAVASYPFLVRLLANNERDKFDATINSALNAGLKLIIPCAVLMIALARPILGLIFEGGRFGMAETDACAPLTQILLLGGPVWIIYMVLARGYYAYADTLTPAITGTITAIICVPVYYFIAVPVGMEGLTAISTLSIAVYTFWLIAIWSKRNGFGAFTGLLNRFWLSLVCSLPAGLAAWQISIILPELNFHGLLNYGLQLCAGTAGFLVIFSLMISYFDSDFKRSLLDRLRRVKI